MKHLLRNSIFGALGLMFIFAVFRTLAGPSVSPNSFIPEALRVATSLKVNVAEYYLSEGKFPDSNFAMNLPLSTAYATDHVGSVEVVTGGVIVVRAKRSSDIIQLIPSAPENALAITWRCVSPNMESIGRIVSACTYERGR